MKARRAAVMLWLRPIIIAGMLLFSVKAVAQQQHWLIGTWTGTIEPEAIYHQYDTKTPAARTMVVTAVGPDGNCVGTFSNPMRPIIAQITVASDEVTIITSNQRGNRGLFGARTFHLRREGQIFKRYTIVPTAEVERRRSYTSNISYQLPPGW